MKGRGLPKVKLAWGMSLVGSLDLVGLIGRGISLYFVFVTLCFLRCSLRRFRCSSGVLLKRSARPHLDRARPRKLWANVLRWLFRSERLLHQASTRAGWLGASAPVSHMTLSPLSAPGGREEERTANDSLSFLLRGKLPADGTVRSVTTVPPAAPLQLCQHQHYNQQPQRHASQHSLQTPSHCQHVYCVA